MKASLTPMPSDCYPAATPSLELEHTSPSAGASARWGVLSTHAQAERWASANLQRWGYSTYLPTYIALRRDRALHTLTHRVEVPLFPGYLFIRIDHSIWGIRSAPGVKCLLMTAGIPAIVPDAEISRLQAGDEARRSQHADQPAWRPGAASTQAYGPFRGLPSVVHAIRGDKATIGLLMLGHLREVTVPVKCLVPRDE